MFIWHLSNANLIKLTDMKTGSDWIPTIKLLDDAGKHTGDEKMIKLEKQTLGI